MPNLSTNRWLQLALGIVCMIMIANLQYGWTLFVLPIEHAQHWSKTNIQLAFTVFVLCETWLLPFEGYLIDRVGPRPTVAAGGVLIAVAWVLNGQATTLSMLYGGAAIGGAGAGFIYCATVGNALRWFPDRRGLAAGLTAAGFGAGSALTIIPIANMIASRGYQSTFITLRADPGCGGAGGRRAVAQPGRRCGPCQRPVARRHECDAPLAPA
jgi:OFA family oxalate/formate antiporter-like MFS transporter